MNLGVNFRLFRHFQYKGVEDKCQMEIGQGPWAPDQRQEGTWVIVRVVIPLATQKEFPQGQEGDLENRNREDANPDLEVAVGWGVPGRAEVTGSGVLPRS